MPSAEFSRSLDVSRSQQDCWEVLTDVQRVAGWVTVVGDVQEVERLERYTAVLEDRFGPFSLKADVSVAVTDVEEGRTVAFRAKGRDRQVATSIDVDAHLALEPTDSGTTIAVHGKWTVLGTVATMGSGTIRKKADTIVEEFFAAAERELNN